MGLRHACAVALLTFAAVARAQSCAYLSDQLQDAQTALRDVRDNTDLAASKELVKQVRVQLTNAAMSAQSCGCHQSYTELLNAASLARQAEEATDPKMFQDFYNRTVLSYNTAVDNVRICQ